MHNEYSELNLNNLNNGAAVDLVNEEIMNVLRNIHDPNVPVEAVREIRLVIKIKPTKDRHSATTSVSVSSKLAQIAPHESSVGLGFSGNQPKAYVNNMRQMDFIEQE